jgi:hypothetical protein
MELTDSKNDIQAFECILTLNPGTDAKIQTSCARNIATNLRAI